MKKKAILQTQVAVVNASALGLEDGQPVVEGNFIEAWRRDLPDLYAAAAEEARLIDPNCTVFTLEPTRDPSEPPRTGLRAIMVHSQLFIG